VLILAVSLVYVLPSIERNPFVETAVWSALLLGSFIGYGSTLRRLLFSTAHVDLGLRAVWGASVVCFIGGLLMAMSLMKRPAAFLVVEIGVVLLAWSAIRERRALTNRLRFLRHATIVAPGIALAALVIASLFLIRYVGACSDLQTHPWDDDNAYLPFATKILQTGTLLEPFSFRRLSALGGQTLFTALTLVRADEHQLRVFDRGVSLALILLLLLGCRRHGKRLAAAPLLLGSAFVVTLPLLALNTSSYYSGVVFFFAIFRTLSFLQANADNEPSPHTMWRSAIVIGLVAGATCTLRQNYFAPVVALLGVSFISLEFSRKRYRFVETSLVASASFLTLMPWLIVSYRSNHTFLYPLMAGTSNPALALRASGMTWVEEVRLIVWGAFQAGPIRVLPLFFLAGVLLPDPGPRKPLGAMIVGSAFGYVALVHSMTQADADPESLSRYFFGFTCATVLSVLVVAFSQRRDPRTSDQLRVAWVAPTLVVAALSVHWFASVAGLSSGLLSKANFFNEYVVALRRFDQLRQTATRSPACTPPERALYLRLQSCVPAGQRMAVLLDEPFYFDFARNDILNLDTPGFSSPSPGIPYFRGSEVVREYFLKQGIRYIAFVRSDSSRYAYRREFWLEFLVTDSAELHRNEAVYALNFIDTLEAFAGSYQKLFDERGLVLVDLKEGAP